MKRLNDTTVLLQTKLISSQIKEMLPKIKESY